MDPISEADLQSAASSTVKLMGPRPRPGMPAGPRTRKSPIAAHTPNGSSNGRRASSESTAVTSGRNSPTPSSTSAQSPTYERRNTAPFVFLTEDKQVQTDNIPSRSPTPARLEPTPAPAYKVVAKPVTLPFPKPINFTADPIAFRGLTLEAAQWTFTSDQLRDMVSRAIRDSAKESFIKLVSSDATDTEIPAELERLDTLRFTTQAQHRFHFQRRTNLLQALNALASTIPVPPSDDGSNPVSALTAQVAEITAAMDRFTETLLHAAEQRAQIMHVQDVHVSSALAMALRKLNASYSKRTADLKLARSRIEALEAELEEAWKVAEDMAHEIDDLDHFEEEYGLGGEIEDSEEGAAVPDSGGLGVDLDDGFTIRSVANAQVVGITKAVATKAVLVSSPTTEAAPDTKRRERAQSTSRPNSAAGAASKVSAARRRSSRTSKASLRIPKSLINAAEGSTSHKRTRSRSNTRKSPIDAEEVPPMPSANGVIKDSFLELSRPGSPQPSSDEDIPPVPTLLNVTRSATEDGGSGASDRAAEDVKEEAGGVEIEAKDEDGSDASGLFSAGLDRSLIPEIETSSQLLRPTSVAIEQLESSHSHSVKPRRIQSMQSSMTLSAAAISDTRQELDNLYEDSEDSPAVLGYTRASEDSPGPGPDLPSSTETGTETDTKRGEYDKFDPWPWSSKKKPPAPSRPVPAPPTPGSPTPSFLPSIPVLPTGIGTSTAGGTGTLKGSASSLFRFRSGRRNSMPSPSGAIAALLPWRAVSTKRPSSEPDLPSREP